MTRSHDVAQEKTSSIKFGLMFCLELVAAMIGYAVILLIFEPIYGRDALGLAVLPVIVIAWRMGFFIGLMAGTFMCVINAVLWYQLAYSEEMPFFPGFLAGGTAGVSVGLAVGLLSDMRNTLRERNLELTEEASLRHQVEQDLRASEKQSQQIFASMRDGVVISSGTTRVYANQAFADLLGLKDASAAIGTDFGEYVHPDDREATIARAFARQRGETVQEINEFRIRHTNGETKIVEASGASIFYNGQPASLSVMRDVTEQRKTQRDLLASQVQSREILESMRDAVVIYSGTKIKYVNDAYASLVGLADSSEAIGSSLGSFLHPEDREVALAKAMARQHDETKPTVNEYRIVRTDGETRFIQSSSVRMIYYGQPASLSVLRDVTWQKEEEQERILRTQELEALTRITSILVAPSAGQNKLDDAFEEFANVSGSERATLRLLSDDKKFFHTVSGAGSIRADQRDTVPVQEGISATVLQQGKAMVFNDYPSHPQAIKALVDQGIKSVVVLPLKINGEIKGIITADSMNPGHFTENRVRLLVSISNGIGALVDNIWLADNLVAQLSNRRKRFKAFQTAVTGMTLKGSPTEGLQNLVDGARELSGATYSALAVWGDDGGIETWMVSGLSDEEQNAISGLPTGSGLLGLLRQGGVVRTADASTHGNYQGIPANHPPIKGFLGVPILLSGNQYGALFVANVTEGGEFSDDDEELLRLFASIAGVHLENGTLYEEVSLERSTLAAVQAGMTEGLLVVDTEGKINYFNHAAEKLLGLDPTRAKNAPIRDAFGLTTPDQETEKMLESLFSMLQKGVEAPIIVELVLLNPAQLHLSFALFPIPDVSGKPMSGMVVRDVTRERLLEQRRDTFVSVASHELRTPMTAVMGFAELLLDRDPGKAMRREWLRHIHHDSQRLAAIVDDLLNVSRIQAGQLTMNWANVSLSALIEDEVSKLKESSHNHQFNTDALCDLPDFAADEYKLAQVIGNLLDNAVKYSPAGGTITVKTEYEPENHRVVTSIGDQGVGIALEDQLDLFNSFRRISREETQHVGGTGLGLYVVKELVELMQGEVWLDSVVNQGTTFYFSIPIIPSNTEDYGDLQEKAVNTV